MLLGQSIRGIRRRQLLGRPVPDARREVRPQTSDSPTCPPAGQGAYELAYQAGFRFELDDGLPRDNNVLLPSKDALVSDHGVSLFVVGELAGQTGWQDRVSRGQEVGREIAQNIQQAGNG